MKPEISAHFRGRKPSAIRQAQIFFAARPDRESISVVNVAIGNVSLPMHPAMQARMRSLGVPPSPFADGVVKYTETVGLAETRAAFLNLIASGGFDTEGLDCVITDGGSQAMLLMVLGVCGPSSDRPLMLLDPAYTNYMDMAKRCAVRCISVRRELADNGSFTKVDTGAVEELINRHRPKGLVVIPADNPTGQFLSQDDLNIVGELCVRHNMWLVSDEAYRQLNYGGSGTSSIWGIRESDVPGITGRRISVESSSKVWNACGLRMGALVTDNPELHAKTVAEHTADLCANAIGQYIFGALAHESHGSLTSWYERQRSYYADLMSEVTEGLRKRLPELVVSHPEASLYSVVDVRNIAPRGFDASAFVAYCAKDGRVSLDGREHTLLTAPMNGFYGDPADQEGVAATQMRIAFVEPPDQMRKVPYLFVKLLERYLDHSSGA